MQTNFLNRYLYSPVTWLHNLSPYIKISTTLMILHAVNYVNSQLIIICIFIYFLIIISLKLSNTYIINLLKVLAIIISPTILNCLINKKIFDLNKSKNTYIYILFSIKLAYEKNYIRIMYREYFIPYFILRVCSLSIINFLCLQILFTTTLYEDIVIRTISLYKFINSNKNKAIKTFVTIVTCSSQFATAITNYLYRTRILFKLHNYSLNSYYIIIIYSIFNAINFMKTYIHNIAIILHIRTKINLYIDIF